MNIFIFYAGCGVIIFLPGFGYTAVFFSSSVFGHQNPGSGWVPDPDSLKMPDPNPQLLMIYVTNSSFRSETSWTGFAS